MDEGESLDAGWVWLLRKLPRSREAALVAVETVVRLLRGRIAFRHARRGGRIYAGVPLQIDARGDIAVGHRVSFYGGMIATRLTCHPGAAIAVGAGSQFSYGVSIEARRSVTIGERCRVGSMVSIADTVHGRTAPVTIGNDVWIAHGAIIEPGTTIGDGSVVSAGSVVGGAIPKGSLVVGNPARAIRLEAIAGSASY